MRGVVGRCLVSIMLVAYLSVSLASSHRKTAAGKFVYKQLNWIPRSLCLWQNWGMFAPPPSSTSWVSLEGKRADDTVVELDTLYEPLEEEFFRWRYDRLIKLSISGFSKSRDGLRKGMAQYACRQAALLGEPLTEVTLIRDRTWPLGPKTRRNNPTKKRKHKRIVMGTYPCP